MKAVMNSARMLCHPSSVMKKVTLTEINCAALCAFSSESALALWLTYTNRTQTRG
jgi:hypothetical protein